MICPGRTCCVFILQFGKAREPCLLALYIESLTLMVDHDAPDQRGRQAGQDAATECWHRWTDAGRELRAFSTDKEDTDITTVIERGAHHG
jgi:hypothetical protein